jgi:hypothetical protein
MEQGSGGCYLLSKLKGQAGEHVMRINISSTSRSPVSTPAAFTPPVSVSALKCVNRYSPNREIRSLNCHARSPPTLTPNATSGLTSVTSNAGPADIGGRSRPFGNALLVNSGRRSINSNEDTAMVDGISKSGIGTLPLTPATTFIGVSTMLPLKSAVALPLTVCEFMSGAKQNTSRARPMSGAASNQ